MCLLGQRTAGSTLCRSHGYVSLVSTTVPLTGGGVEFNQKLAYRADRLSPKFGIYIYGKRSICQKKKSLDAKIAYSVSKS